MKIQQITSISTLLVLAFLPACKTPEFKQQTGTTLETTDQGTKAVTYVTPEEYQKMTEAERTRLNAQIGVSATIPIASWGGKDKASKPVTSADLDKALKK